MKTRGEAVHEAGQHLATARRVADSMTPRQLAEASWHVGCGHTVDELEDRIRERRGLSPIHARAS